MMLAMFELLYPLYFVVGGAIAVGVSLILHLIQSRRTVRIPFSTIRFLQMAQKRSSNKIKMENILLWLIRTFMLLALALAFAMPMLRTKALSGWLGRSARDVAIVIDGSYSMSYNLGRATVWDKAIEQAVAVLEGLEEQHRFCIFVAREHVEPVIEQLSGDKEEAISRIKALTFSQTSSQLAPAVMEANTALDESEVRHEREIHIITDTQTLPWESMGEGGGGDAEAPVEEAADAGEGGDAVTPEAASSEDVVIAAMGVWDPNKIDDRTSIFVSTLGAKTPENMAPVEVVLEPSVIMADMPSKASVRLGYTGPARSTAVTLTIDDEEIASRSVSIGDNMVANLSFLIPPMPAGRYTARVDLPDDNLQLDNAFHFLLKVEEQFPTLCIGTEDDTFFLRAALSVRLGEKAAIEAEWAEPSNVAIDKFDSYDCIFVCNAVPLSATAVSALERFVEAGGLLILFPGEKGAPADYQSWTCLPGIPSEVHQVAVNDRGRIMNWDNPNHSVLRDLRIGSAAPTVTIKRHVVWQELASSAERLVSHGDGNPFLLGRAFGRGYVLFFAVSADRSWSDFPLSPFYLPLVHQVVQFGAGVGSYDHFVWCADSLPLVTHLPDATASTSLLGPDGKSIPVRSANVSGQVILHVENLHQAGVVTMQGGGAPIPAIAVNMNRVESDLTPIAPDTIPSRLDLDHVYVAEDLQVLLQFIQDVRVGRTFGEQMFWLALILAGVEFFYANRLMSRAPGLSEKLGIDIAGNMPAHREGI